MSQELFVYNGTIVVKTGRKAKKDQPKKDQETTVRRTRTSTVDELYEITPADQEEGSWKKWVRMTELYTIVEDGND